MSARQLACQEVVARTATSDRARAADLILSLACTKAVALLRDGAPGHAEFVLTRALMSAERINPPALDEVPL